MLASRTHKQVFNLGGEDKSSLKPRQVIVFYRLADGRGIVRIRLRASGKCSATKLHPHTLSHIRLCQDLGQQDSTGQCVDPHEEQSDSVKIKSVFPLA